ncbi:MAG: hypothetical protein U0Q11_25615 [Vicinamibacterales bacterium]
MTNEHALIDDEPVLPSSYLRAGPSTSGELWALDRWRQERRWRTQPIARAFNRIGPLVFFGLGLFGIATGLGTIVGLTPGMAGVIGIMGLLIAVLTNYERQGYIRLLERYAAELGELRGGNREPRA